MAEELVRDLEHRLPLWVLMSDLGIILAGISMQAVGHGGADQFSGP